MLHHAAPAHNLHTHKGNCFPSPTTTTQQHKTTQQHATTQQHTTTRNNTPPQQHTHPITQQHNNTITKQHKTATLRARQDQGRRLPQVQALLEGQGRDQAARLHGRREEGRSGRVDRRQHWRLRRQARPDRAPRRGRQEARRGEAVRAPRAARGGEEGRVGAGPGARAEGVCGVLCQGDGARRREGRGLRAEGQCVGVCVSLCWLVGGGCR